MLALNQQALGRETRPPEGYGPTSNLSLASNESLRSQADLTNLFYDGPNFAATGGTEQDEHLRLYLEHVKAKPTFKGKKGAATRFGTVRETGQVTLK